MKSNMMNPEKWLQKDFFLKWQIKNILFGNIIQCCEKKTFCQFLICCLFGWVSDFVM